MVTIACAVETNIGELVNSSIVTIFEYFMSVSSADFFHDLLDYSEQWRGVHGSSKKSVVQNRRYKNLVLKPPAKGTKFDWPKGQIQAVIIAWRLWCWRFGRRITLP